MSTIHKAVQKAVEDPILFNKLQKTRTLDEIVTLANDNGYQLTKEDVRHYLASGNVDPKLAPNNTDADFCIAHKA